MLAVGDSTKLEIIFSAGNKPGIVTKGPVITTNEGLPDKRVVIKTNIEANPDSTFPIVITPPKLEFKQMGDSMPEELDFTLSNKSRNTVTPKLVSSSLPTATVILPGAIPPGKSATGTIRIPKAGPRAGQEKSITIVLDDSDKTRFTIPVKITFAGKIIPPGKRFGEGY